MYIHIYIYIYIYIGVSYLCFMKLVLCFLSPITGHISIGPGSENCARDGWHCIGSSNMMFSCDIKVHNTII